MPCPVARGRRRSALNAMAGTARTGSAFNLLSAFGAFLLWGGWAWYVNGPGSAAGLLSGVTQGAFSFCMTLVLVYLVTHMRGYFATDSARLLLPPVLTVCATTALLVLIHWAISTPRLLATILPTVSVALLFSLFTSFRLHRIEGTDG